MSVALLAMALSAFVMGTAEFVITGLLPEVAADLMISIPAAGVLISGYALAIVVGGPLCTVGGSRVPRKTLLLLSVALFVAGNLVCALAPGYWILMIGRVLAAFGQASFLGIGSVVAANLVAPTKRSRAIAMVFTGITVANVVGSPLGTLIGQNLGWRVTFWLITGVAVLSFAGLAALVPAQPPPVATGVRRELAVFGGLRVWLTLAICMFAMGAVFSTFSYVAPLLTEVTGIASNGITLVLALFGLGLVAGNLIGGWCADRAVLPTFYGALALLTVFLVGFALLAPFVVPAVVLLVLIGAAGFAVVPAFMSRLIGLAGGESPFAGAAGGSASNSGIAVGAYAGGLVITAGFGYAAPAWLGAGLAFTGLLVALLLGALEARGRRGALGEHVTAATVR
ncbi:MFS transporter [Parasphingorhabdus pacifica]